METDLFYSHEALELVVYGIMRLVCCVVFVAVHMQFAVANTVTTTLLTIKGKALDPNFKIGEKNKDFVNKIKANLRRDNEDYEDRARAQSVAAVGGGNGSNPEVEREKHRRALGTVPLRMASTRRMLISIFSKVPQKPYEPTIEPTLPPVGFNQRYTHIASDPPYDFEPEPYTPIALNPFRSGSRTGAAPAATMLGPITSPKENYNKYKQFIAKNKDLLRKLVSYKQLLKSVRAASSTQSVDKTSSMQLTKARPSAPPQRMSIPTLVQHRRLSISPLGMSTPSKPLLFHRLINRQHPPRPSFASVPPPENVVYENSDDPDYPKGGLDMSPARMQKGRMCFRHVLMPEGPKYDRKGHIYLKAFSPPHFGLDYARTKPPAYLLPRCCNCCKKSVLGCE